MANFGIFKGFSDKLFEGELPTNLGTIGSVALYLLDVYPNAAAAYSLRLLRSAYTGSAIRVRRSSDNTEQDIGFNGVNLDTSALTSFCGSSNGFVTTWYDQSGNARNATQTTAANQPQIVSSGSVITENGKPCVQYDGSNDYLIYNGTVPTSSELSIFGKLKKITQIDNRGFFSLIPTGSSPNDRDWASIDGRTFNMGTSNSRFDFTGHIIFSGSNGFTNPVDIKQSITINTPFIFSAIEANLAASVNINGSNMINDTYNGTPTNPNGIIIGARYDTSITQYGNITASELIFYNFDQTSNRTAINTNLNIYYGIY